MVSLWGPQGCLCLKQGLEVGGYDFLVEGKEKNLLGNLYEGTANLSTVPPSHLSFSLFFPKGRCINYHECLVPGTEMNMFIYVYVSKFIGSTGLLRENYTLHVAIIFEKHTVLQKFE